ncbi:unnamed protein product [Blepharisma stoltei]|uniref:Uncharacterized protein n=1 Tax=Blepharisma stoltei TaxID=1481888 RepID=A0AAU9JS42_9CILI|nr:unnamed protein product [Blepharisma stoltei]
MYTLGREAKIPWDSEEPFPPKKLITTHFDKDIAEPCPFPLKEISTNVIHNHEKNNYLPKPFNIPQNFKVDDGTRASSPISYTRLSPSPLIPSKQAQAFDSFDEESNSTYNRKVDSIKSQLEQLYLVRDRHIGIKLYINSIKEQLQNNLKLGVAELQSKRNAYVAQIDEQYDLSFNQLCINHKEKELKIKIKDQELECVLCQIKNTISTIELKLRAEPKQRFMDHFDKIYRESEETLKVWAPECDLSPEWTHLDTPSFDLHIKPRDVELPKENKLLNDINLSEISKTSDALTLRTENSHKELMSDEIPIQDEKKNFNLPCGSHRCSLRRRGQSTDKSKKDKNYEELAKKNLEMAQRISKIEKSIADKSIHISRKPSVELATEATSRSNSDILSTFEESESLISISTLFTEDSDHFKLNPSLNRLKIYIPQGYPAYSNYYYVKYYSESKIEDILNSLCETMKINKDEYVLKVKEKEGKSRSLGVNEKVNDLYKIDKRNWPKVFLQKIKV